MLSRRSFRHKIPLGLRHSAGRLVSPLPPDGLPGGGQKAAAEAVRAKARAAAGDLLPEIEKLQAAGITSATGIAKALNEIPIPAPRGGAWQATQVQRLLARVLAPPSLPFLLTIPMME
jgi:hypothetical protein